MAHCEVWRYGGKHSAAGDREKQYGWHVFSSARLEEGPYEGLYVAEGGAYDGKIVERTAAGEEVRPLDISITKNVLGLFINSAVLLVIMMSCVRWYKKHPLEDGAPKGASA